MANSSSPPGNVLGTGWSFPPSFDRHEGSVQLSSDLASVRESLCILFSTDIGERTMLEKYGTFLRRRVFAALTATTSNELKLEIRSAILDWEPRIDVIDIEIMDRQEVVGMIELVVHFSLRKTNVRSSLIYPFYLKEASTPTPRGGGGLA
jgi:phage baseplate assembly protein W